MIRWGISNCAIHGERPRWPGGGDEKDEREEIRQLVEKIRKK